MRWQKNILYKKKKLEFFKNTNYYKMVIANLFQLPQKHYGINVSSHSVRSFPALFTLTFYDVLLNHYLDHIYMLLSCSTFLISLFFYLILHVDIVMWIDEGNSRKMVMAMEEMEIFLHGIVKNGI